MTDYADIPTVNTLYGEQERTQQAMDMLAAGGTMTSFTIAPPPPPTTGGTPAPSPMAMSVSIQVTEPISDEMLTALNDWLTARQQNIIDELATYEVGPPPPPITDPPVNRDVPYAEQQNTVLNCTMGNWDNMQATGASYAYLWKKDDGTAVGTAANYPIAFADVGSTFSCVVTATNAIGSTTAPPSNSVTVVSPPSP